VALDIDLEVEHTPARKVDVPINYLDITRYEEAYGKLNPISLEEGIKKTAIFMKEHGMV
jgi:UDP-glucose 4-epimerase